MRTEAEIWELAEALKSPLENHPDLQTRLVSYYTMMPLLWALGEECGGEFAEMVREAKAWSQRRKHGRN